MTEPCRALIEWDHRAGGIWLVSTKEEREAATYEEWSNLQRALHWPPRPPAHRPWGDLLSDQLLDDLKAWNDWVWDKNVGDWPVAWSGQGV